MNLYEAYLLCEEFIEKDLGVNIVNLNNTGTTKEQTLELILGIIKS